MSKVEKYIGESKLDSKPQRNLGFKLIDNIIKTKHLDDAIVTGEKLAPGCIDESKLASDITDRLSEIEDNVESKVDKVDGKILSSNDFTDSYKNGLSRIISEFSSVKNNAIIGSRAYQKPDSGIPKSDLSQEVQDSLDKADIVQMVNWEGVLSVGSNFEFSIPDHTYTEMCEIMDAGISIHITFLYGGTPAIDFLSQRSLFRGYTFKTIDATFHEYDSSAIGVYTLIAAAGANNTISLSFTVNDSHDYYTKDQVDTKVSEAITPVEQQKLSYTIVESLPAYYQADANKLYLIADNNTNAYRGYLLNGNSLYPLGYIKPRQGIPATDLTQGIQDTLAAADTAYQKPDSGIPAEDLSSDIQESLAVAGEMAEKLDSGLTADDMSSSVRTSLNRANITYTAVQNYIIGNKRLIFNNDHSVSWESIS